MVGGIAGGNPVPALLDLVQDLVLLSWSITLVNFCRSPSVLRRVLHAWALAGPLWGLVLIAAYLGQIDAVSGVIAANGARADPNMAASYFVLWARLARDGYFRGWGRPSKDLARQIVTFGVRSQAGNLMTLLNLRLDSLLIGALVGPATLGIYSIASRYAELIRLLPIAINWVLYPRFARDEPAQAFSRARHLVPLLGGATALSAIPLFALTDVIIPFLFGPSFAPAILPAHILFRGLAGEWLGAVIVSFLYGRGRPGLASIASGCGLAVTAVMDVLLIPRWGVVGAAVTSSVAYLVTDVILLTFFIVLARRMLDIGIAALGLLITAPLLVLLAAARISTGGSAIYWQESWKTRHSFGPRGCSSKPPTTCSDPSSRAHELPKAEQDRLSR